MKTKKPRRTAFLGGVFPRFLGLFLIPGLAALPAAGACPRGAPSCTTSYEVREVPLVIDLAKVPDLCADLTGAQIQAFGENGNGRGVLRAQLYHPVNRNGDLLRGPWPAVVSMPGAGLDYLEYGDLLTHLAAQGAVALILEADTNSSVAQRADLQLCGLRYLRFAWSESRVTSRAVFTGHSRGGEGAVMAANRLKVLEFEGSPFEREVNLVAVAVMAPSAQCDNPITSHICVPKNSGYAANLAYADLLDEATSALFVIQGSQDGDVLAQSLRLYEDASSEGPGFLEGDMTKSMAWVYGVSHTSWGGVPVQAPSSRGAVLARAYVGAFVAWWLHGASEYRPFFTGEERPPCVAKPDDCELDFETPEIFLQYREGSAYKGERARVHDFEAPQPLNPSYAGPLFPTPPGSAEVVDMLSHNPPHNGRVSTRAVAVTQLDIQETALRFDFTEIGDLTRFAFLSLRLGKPAVVLGEGEKNCAPADPGDLSVRIALADSGGARHEVTSAEYARVTDPDLYWWMTVTSFCTGYDYLTTVRVPLLEFWQGGVDPRYVDELELRFPVAPPDGGVHEVLVDSVEFTVNDLDPRCGNGVVETQERCDTSPPAGESCADYGFWGGVLACDSACLVDTSGCTEAICGNGIVEGEEECDDGNEDPWDDCTADCTICPAGEPYCRCLGIEPEEQDPLYPEGMPGNGGYCHDDVMFGGYNRCVEFATGQRGCVACNEGQGPFCPCDPSGSGCFPDFGPGIEGNVASPDVPAGATMTCVYAQQAPPLPLEPALAHGYCFAEDEATEDGGMPEWFFDRYCEAWDDEASHAVHAELGDVCELP